MNELNNIAKFISKPVGKKFSTTMIMKDGREVVMKKAGAYKAYANVCFFNNKPVTGCCDTDITFNSKSVHSSFLRSCNTGDNQKVTHLVFDVELAD